MTKEEIKIFVKFLKDNNKFEQFKFYSNSKEYFGNCDRRLFPTIEAYLKDVSSYNVLQYAFFWSATKENDYFWRILNENWIKKIK